MVDGEGKIVDVYLTVINVVVCIFVVRYPRPVSPHIFLANSDYRSVWAFNRPTLDDVLFKVFIHVFV